MSPVVKRGGGSSHHKRGVCGRRDVLKVDCRLKVDSAMAEDCLVMIKVITFKGRSAA